jgi:hypothetical protein
MPATRKEDAPVVLDEPEITGRYVELGAYTVALDPTRTDELAAGLVRYLETGEAAPGLFAPAVFCDFTMPTWRIQGKGVAAVLALRSAGHPYQGRVPRHRVDHTARGFVLEFEEEWVDEKGAAWYCREILRADIAPDGIVDLAVYCTGDWDEARVAEHTLAVELIRP